MDLKQFVSETITQIIQGVANAQRAAEESDAYVNPGDFLASSRTEKSPSVQVPGRGNKEWPIQMIEFDVAVLAKDDTTSKIGGGVLTVVSMGASRESNSSSETTSRVRFSVPVAFPLHTAFKKSVVPAPPPARQSP